MLRLFRGNMGGGLKIWTDDERPSPDSFILPEGACPVLHGIIWNYTPPEIRIHTANPSVRIKMEAGVRAIQKIVDSRSTP